MKRISWQPSHNSDAKNCYTAVTACKDQISYIAPPKVRQERKNTMASPGDHSVGSTSFATGPKILPSFEFDQRVKRAFDILAATMCLMLFSPILLMTSIAIKLDSPGPIFVREALIRI